MSHQNAPRIHPTAVISPEVQLADDVTVGPYCVLEGEVSIGSGSVLRTHVTVVGPMRIGTNNKIFSGAVLGEKPQHLRCTQQSGLEIGNNNIIREHVTIHSATHKDIPTRIGDNNFLMANSHIAHDCQVGNRCIIANGALVGGHCVLEDEVYLSGNVGVHQFVQLGRLSLMSGGAMTTKDVPPFVIQQNMNCVMGLNVVGMRRAGMSHEQIDLIRRAFLIVFREKLSLKNAIDQADAEVGHDPAVAYFLNFLRHSSRGINGMRENSRAA